MWFIWIPWALIASDTGIQENYSGSESFEMPECFDNWVDVLKI